MTPYGFLPFPKASGADGNQLPPGFQFPVKELVACMKALVREVYKTSLFL
jgi:hypothetical protein